MAPKKTAVSDVLLAGGFIRPSTLLAGLRIGGVSLQRLPVVLLISLSGLIAEPFAWIQSLYFGSRIQSSRCPDDPVVIIGHWRSGTTYLHQLLAADPCAATARNHFTMVPQAALLLKPWLRVLLRTVMTRQRPIDAVPWGPDDPQEDEVGLARLTMETNMAGVALPLQYLRHFRHCVLDCSPQFEQQLLHFTKLTWLQDGAGKHHLVIKNSAHTARVGLLLRLFPRARFIYLHRRPIDSIRSLVIVKQRLASLMGLQRPPSVIRQVEETVWAHDQLRKAFEQSRHLIPAGQLIEVEYDDLVQTPFEVLQRIYAVLGLRGWSLARDSIAVRVDEAKRYRAEPVVLEEKAEQHLQMLLSQS